MKRITAIILAVLMVLAIASGAVGEENKIWFKGDAGEKVTWIQTRLKELEYLDKEPTGIFDEASAFPELLTRLSNTMDKSKTGIFFSRTSLMSE